MSKPNHLPIQMERFIKCSCGEHGLMFLAWLDDRFFDKDNPSNNLEISFFSSGFGKYKYLSWKDRIKCAWQTLRYGTPYQDMVLLDEKEIFDLHYFLEKVTKTIFKRNKGARIMSADNGIFIAKFKDGYRVTHGQAFLDNVNFYPEFSGKRKEILKMYFKDSEVYKNESDALKKAKDIEEDILNSDIPIIEYGIVTCTFKEDIKWH